MQLHEIFLVSHKEKKNNHNLSILETRGNLLCFKDNIVC